jgi:threonine dehydratase
MTDIDRNAIAAIHRVIAPHIRRTPVLEVSGRDLGLGDCRLFFKLECLQCAGSFKARGAFAHLVTRDVPQAGVVAASGGNHGAAVAYAAAQLKVPATIFVPTVSSPAKVARIRACGAHLEITGDGYDAALEASEAWRAKTGAMRVHAFDARETLLGQGTLALELDEQVPALDAVLVAVGGGGLVAGIAAWYRGATRIVGVEPHNAPTLTYALRAGKPVDAPAGGLAADSLAPRRIGELVYPFARDHVESVVLVSDEDIARSQQTLWETIRIAAEPGGAAAFAPLLSGAYLAEPGERVGIIISGGNTTLTNGRYVEGS